MTDRWLALVDVATAMLDPNERVAVRGDLQEGGIGGPRALREILGLIARRQILVWTGWRPWIALLAVSIPLGLLLGAVSRRWSYTSAIYAWLYVDNWTWAYLDSSGSRVELVRTIAAFVPRLLALAAASWASGFVLAVFSGRAVWTSGAVFCFALAAGFAMAPPVAEQHAVVFALPFYRLVLPLLTATALVAVPSAIGMKTAIRR
jgi:hypothetical protein